jgi:6-phosphofructokinase 1
MKTIGVLTSGGDSPGMNAAIRAVVRTGLDKHLRVMGIERGFTGLMDGEIFQMERFNVADIIQRGGTVLRTSRSAEFMTEEGQNKAYNILKAYGIEGLIVIGGDGTFRGALALAKYGIPIIGLPGTIDNDLAYTDYTIGFDTCVNTVLDAINKIRDTATSHERVSVVEVMGRHCGDIALFSGIAGGAECILVPEIGYTKEDVCRKILEGKQRGKRHNLIVIAEGAGGTVDLVKYIQEVTGLEARATILGYIQRGGSPSAMDRLMASKMGYKAVDLLLKGKSSRLIGIKHNKIIDEDVQEAMSLVKRIDEKLYEIADVLSY